MKERVILDRVLLIGVLAVFSQGANALSFGGTGTYFTKGVRCLSTVKGVSGNDIKNAAVAEECVINNVNSAIVYCTNQPNNGTPQGTAWDQFYEFPTGLQTGSAINCDKVKGKCDFNVVSNATGLIGQHSPACVSPTWVVVDVVPVNFDGTQRAYECKDANSHVIACDSNLDGVIDCGVTSVNTIEQKASCTLPDQNSLQFGESRAYECTVISTTTTPDVVHTCP